jgi:polyhydroxybutyrate depolymerase
MRFISALILSVLGLGGIPLLLVTRSIDDSISPTNIQISAGDATRTIAVGVDKRRYRVFVPQSYSAKTPTPVVLVFHGGGGNPDGMMRMTGMNAKAQGAGFIVVYPYGSGINPNRGLTFNGGECCGFAKENKVDDVAFTRALLDDLAKVANVDADRVYATGLSNGGIMSHYLGSELTDRIAAIAPVGGPLMMSAVRPSRPISVMQFHGTKDEFAPYEGGGGKGPLGRTGVTKFRSVDYTLQTWIKANGCNPNAKVVALPDKAEDGMKSTRKTWSGGKDGSEVVLIEIEGGGHTWPGMDPPMDTLGKSTKDFSANDLMWEFFQKHPRKTHTAPVEAARSATPQWMTPAVQAPRVTQQTLESKAAKAKVSYHVYLPKAYEQEKSKRFPVLYWLHGSGGGLPGIRPISGFFDAAIEAGKIPPMIVVFPNSFVNGMWCDSADGKQPIETIVIKELIPEVDSKFRTIAKRDGRIVEGFSMGGYGAGRLGFKYADMFAGLSMLASGPLDLEFKGPRAEANPSERDRILQSVYGGKMETFKAQSPWILAEQNASKLKSEKMIRICIGAEDFTLPANRKFSAHLTKLGVPHDFVTKPQVGHDTIALLTALGEDNWKFYRQGLSGLD